MLEALLRLDPANSRILGQHFQQLADQLLARASTAATQAAGDERRRARARGAHQAAKVALRLTERGLEPDDAIARVARKHDLEPGQVRAWLEIERKKQGARKRLRNVKIMRLAGRGWTDKEIAAKYQMHAKSVNRIVRRMLRENPPTLPAHP